MIIILKKDGQVVTDEANPVDVKAMDNAAMILADPQNGNTIVYNASAGMWVAREGGGSFAPDITDPQDGDTLVYDASEDKWVNGSGGSGGGALVVECTKDGSVYTLGKTAGEIVTALSGGQNVIVHFPDEQYYSDQYSPVSGVYADPSGDTKYYNFFIDFEGNTQQFSCLGADTYPELSFG